MGSLHSTTATFWFHKHQYLAAPLFLGSFYAAMVLVFLIVMFVIYALDPGPDPFIIPGCMDTQIYNVGIQAALGLAVLLVFVVKLWRVKDSFYIKQELLVILIGIPPLFLIFIVCFVLNSLMATNVFMAAAPFYIFVVTLIGPVVLSYTKANTPDDPTDNELIVSKRAGGPRSRSGTGTLKPEEIFKACLSDEDLFNSFTRFCVLSW